MFRLCINIKLEWSYHKWIVIYNWCAHVSSVTTCGQIFLGSILISKFFNIVSDTLGCISITLRMVYGHMPPPKYFWVIVLNMTLFIHSTVHSWSDHRSLMLIPYMNGEPLFTHDHTSRHIWFISYPYFSVFKYFYH